MLKVHYSHTYRQTEEVIISLVRNNLPLPNFFFVCIFITLHSFQARWCNMSVEWSCHCLTNWSTSRLKDRKAVHNVPKLLNLSQIGTQHRLHYILAPAVWSKSTLILGAVELFLRWVERKGETHSLTWLPWGSLCESKPADRYKHIP